MPYLWNAAKTITFVGGFSMLDGCGQKMDHGHVGTVVLPIGA